MRLAGLCESISFLILLFVAMPLKYAAGAPEAVLYVGWLHGLLFITFAAVTFLAWGSGQITSRLVGLAAIASVIPFGPFFISRELNFFAIRKDSSEKPTDTATTEPIGAGSGRE